jgi:hypothetical protein
MNFHRFSALDLRHGRRAGVRAARGRAGPGRLARPSRSARRAVLGGGANDLMARAAAEGASKQLGQPVIIDNKPGAGAILGADVVAKSAPDGYTFLVSAAGVVSNSMIKKKSCRTRTTRWCPWP